MKNLFSVFLILFSLTVKAVNYDDYLLINNSNHCNNYFEHIERQFQIPKDILRAISIIETGRWHPTMKNYFPWPWTINQAGKSYYLSTKREAINLVRKMLQNGATNIDIGCMQINLHHHPEAFLDLDQAFDPKENISYAASFLSSHYRQSQNWQQAIASYHSQLSIGDAYAKKVLKIWVACNENKLHPNYCTDGEGKLSSCNNSASSQITSYTQEKEELPLIAQNDRNEDKIIRKEKDWTRLRSSMILYNIQKE